MDVKFETYAPWTVLFGPSGSGKSTILRIVAGLDRPDEGRVVIHGAVVADSAEAKWIPPHSRPMRWAGQRAYLKPGKTVLVLMKEAWGPNYGPAWVDTFEGMLDHFGLREFEQRVPEELSGGQRQLISVARAASHAKAHRSILLLDEPFAGLDAAVRNKLIEALRTWLVTTPVISVTHDVGEAFLLGARVVRIDEGRVVAEGMVGRVLADERKSLLEVLG